MVTVIGAINEFERQNILERQKEGIALAKEQNKFRGRQVKEIDNQLFEETYKEYKNRILNKVQMADKLNISRPTLDRLLKDKGLC